MLWHFSRAFRISPGAAQAISHSRRSLCYSCSCTFGWEAICVVEEHPPVRSTGFSRAFR
jgi:hypothetical protein